jgi:DNA-nicking Smr family endonuclease
MSRKRKLTPEEERLWRAAMKDTVPLQDFLQEMPQRKPGLSKSKAQSSGLKSPPKTPPAKPLFRPQRKPEPALHHLDRRSAQQVRRGQIKIDGKLDLHGMRQVQAHEVLIRYLTSAQSSGKRVVLVVTGKGQTASSGHPWGRDEDTFASRGGGVLQSQVPQWLGQAPLRQMIFSVQKAHPHHGGSGALYVFLKKKS